MIKNYFNFMALVLLVSAPAIAAETIQFTTHRGECTNSKNDLKLKMMLYMAQNQIDGHFIVTSEVIMCSHPAIPSAAYPCACKLTATLQDSSYEILGKNEKVKNTLKSPKRHAELNALLNEVQSRDGYVWHDVSNVHIFFWKGYSVNSLYIARKF